MIHGSKAALVHFNCFPMGLTRFIFAQAAYLIMGPGHINGQVIVQTLTASGGAEFHSEFFQGCIELPGW